MDRNLENVAINNTCPNCGRRLFLPDDGRNGKRLYAPPEWLRRMLRKAFRSVPLGEYYVAKCEVCGKKVAVFCHNEGPLKEQTVVLYSCTLLSIPLPSKEGESCEDQSSCAHCALRESKWYVRR